MTCPHPDIRQFDGIRCCLACGEAIFETSALVTIEQVDTAPSSYKYADLNHVLGLQIRLLVIHPGINPDPIVFSILHVNLEDMPEYEAISYTWATEEGDAQKSQRIYCLDGSFIDVTVNCEAALRHLRRPGLKRRLWVDSVCINQLRVEERNHQVGLMGQIYSKAARVLICIQDPRHSYSDLFDWLKRSTMSRPDGREALMSSIAVEPLFRLRYFRRVWVIQEVALARAAFLHVNESSILLSEVNLSQIWDLCTRQGVTVPKILRRVPGDMVKSDLTDWLTHTIQCESDEPQDKIYAIMSLVAPETRALIPIDYSLDPRQVYALALATIIQEQQSLTVLRYAGIHGNDLETEVGLTLEQFKAYLFLETASPEDRIAYCHSERRPIFAGGFDRRDMFADGFDQSILQFHGESQGPWHFKVKVQGTEDLDRYPMSNVELVSAVVERATKSSPTSRLSIFPRMRVRAHFIDDVREYYIPKYTSQMKQWIGFLLDSRFKDDPGDVLTDLFSDTRLKNYIWIFQYFHLANGEFQTEYITDLKQFASETAFFDGQEILLRTNYSVGFSVLGCRKGDEIWAVDGVRVPLVLRNMGGAKYRVVSRCYLWAALELDCWNPGSKKGLWGVGVEPPQREQTCFIDIH